MIRERRNPTYWHKGVIVLIYLCITVYSADKQELAEIKTSDGIITTNILTDPIETTPLTTAIDNDVSIYS